MVIFLNNDFLQLQKAAYIRPSTNSAAQVNRSERAYCSLSAPRWSWPGEGGRSSRALACSFPLAQLGEAGDLLGVAAKSIREVLSASWWRERWQPLLLPASLPEQGAGQREGESPDRQERQARGSSKKEVLPDAVSTLFRRE